MYKTGWRLPGSPCSIPYSDASVWSMDVRLKSGLLRTGSSPIALFRFWKESSHSSVHRTLLGWFFLVRLERGAERVENPGTKCLHQPTRPRGHKAVSPCKWEPNGSTANWKCPNRVLNAVTSLLSSVNGSASTSYIGPGYSISWPHLIFQQGHQPWAWRSSCLLSSARYVNSSSFSWSSVGRYCLFISSSSTPLKKDKIGFRVFWNRSGVPFLQQINMKCLKWLLPL